MGLLWALLSDVDIESECWRILGALRMDLAGVLRILSLRVYRARVLYRLETDTTTLYGVYRDALSAPPVRNLDHFTREYLRCGKFSNAHLNALPVCCGPKSCPVCALHSQCVVVNNSLTTTTNVATSSSSVSVSSSSIQQSEQPQTQTETKKISPDTHENATSEMAVDGTAMHREPIVACDATRRRRRKRSNTNKASHEGEKKRNSVPPHESEASLTMSSPPPYLSKELPTEATPGCDVFIGLHPDLRPLIPFHPDRYLSTNSSTSEASALPEYWFQIEDDFTFFALVNFAHIASNANPAPYAHPHSGHLDLVYTHSQKSRKFLAAFAGGIFESGAYVHKPWVHYTKVRACILEPLESSYPQKGRLSPLGLIDLDGELLGMTTFSAELSALFRKKLRH
jgi:hypothetical protein